MAKEASRYRWILISVAAVCMVLAAFTVWFEFAAYTDYRTPDFTKASAGQIDGTCVEAVTDDQLKMAFYDKSDWSCGTNSKEDLSNLLASSVHAMYSANKVTEYSGAAKAVYDAVIMATQGQASEYSITRADAYATLKVVGTPSSTDCAVLYAGATEGAASAALAPTVVCDADLPASNVAPTATEDANKLYTHCVEQFSYGRSYPAQGTFTIPKVGTKVEPRILPIIGTNSTTAWNDRARILVGTRWGYATVVYVIFVMGSAFFFMDCAILLLAELTRVDAYFAQNAITEGNRRSMKEGHISQNRSRVVQWLRSRPILVCAQMMTMLATFQAKRNLRWAIAIIILILEIVLWVLLIGVPWEFGMGFPRPLCESGDPGHWFPMLFPSTQGGWKLDYDAFVYEICVILAHFLIAIAVPIASLQPRGGGSRNSGQRGRTGGGDLEGYTGVAIGSLRSAWWFAILVVGALVFYIGQAISGFRFGVAWAHGVSKDEFNEIALGAMLHDQINALLYMSITIGLTLGSIIGRWLLAGLSCTSFTIFLIWVLFTVAAFIPPFFVSTYWVFFSFEDSQGQKDCKSTFGDSDDYLFARTACDIRAGTYIAGIILLLVAALGPTIIGLVDYSRVVCLPRRRAWVNMPAYWQRLVDPANPKFRTFENVNGVGDGAIINKAHVHATGQGYRSSDTKFFNYATRLTVAATDVQG